MKFGLCALLTVLMLSCSHKRLSDAEPETVGFDKNGAVSSHAVDIVESIEAIPLETTRECLMSGFGMAYPCSDGYVVFDASFDSRSVMKFDSSGRFVCRIGCRGRADYEYGNIDCMDVENDTVSIFDKNRVLLFDCGGNFISGLKIGSEVRGCGCVSDGGGYWLYCGNFGFSPFKLLHVSSDGGVVASLLPACDKGMSQGVVFSRYGGDIYMTEGFSCDVRRLADDTLHTVLHFDMGELDRYEEIEKSTPEELVGIMQTPNAFVRGYWQGKGYRMALIYAGGKSDSSHYLVYNLAGTSEWVWVKVEKGSRLNVFIWGQPVQSEDGSFVMLLSAATAVRNSDLIDRKLSETLDEESNPVIVRIKFRFE